MQINSVLKIIIVLLIIMILSLAGVIFISKRNSKSPDDTAAVTTDSVTTAGDSTTEGDETTAPDDATSAVTSDTDTTSAVTTTADPVNPPQTDPADPPVNPPEKPTNPAPAGFNLTEELRSDTGTKLNTRAVCTAVESNGKIRLTVELYLDYRSLYMGARKEKYGSLTVGDQTVTFSTDAISEEENIMHSKLLCSNIQYVNYGDTVRIYSSFWAGVVYSNVNISNIIIDDSITLK